MIRDAADMAVQDGATRLGLGAFTSIVTRGGETVTGRGVPITSGNTLTTVSAVQSIERVARRVGLSIEESHVVVIGASGAIGRLAALMLARRAGRLTLVGNAGNPFAATLLSRVADEVHASVLATPPGFAALPGSISVRISEATNQVEARGPGIADRMTKRFLHRDERPPVTWTTDRQAALADADIVLVATSSEITLVDPRELRPGTLVCDVARPPNVAQSDLTDSGVLVFDGGLVHPPSMIDLGPFQTLPKHLCWGCLGETMLLALSGVEKDFSIGSKLPLADADLIASLADRHGFQPAQPQWYGSNLTEADFDRFARHVAGSDFRRFAPLPAALPDHRKVASAS